MIATLVIALTLGAVYALVAIGFSLIYRTTGVISFAQGAFVMLGGMGAGYAAEVWKWSLPAAAAAGLVLATAGSAVLAFGVVLPLWRRGASSFITILGTALFLAIAENLVLVTMGAAPRAVPPAISSQVSVGATAVQAQSIVVILTVAVLSVLLTVFLRRTRAGNAMRACAADREVARLLGISPVRVALVALLITGVLGAVGGILIAPLQFVAYNAGTAYNIRGFIAAMVGGFGDLRGAVLGGLLIGLLEAFIGVYVSTLYLEVLLIAVLLGVLFVRPTGLMAQAAT